MRRIPSVCVGFSVAWPPSTSHAPPESPPHPNRHLAIFALPVFKRAAHYPPSRACQPGRTPTWCTPPRPILPSYQCVSSCCPCALDAVVHLSSSSVIRCVCAVYAARGALATGEDLPSRRIPALQGGAGPTQIVALRGPDTGRMGGQRGDRKPVGRPRGHIVRRFDRTPIGQSSSETALGHTQGPATAAGPPGVQSRWARSGWEN